MLARDRVYVAAVGDITADELGRLLDDLLGGLPATGAPMPPRAEFALTGGVTVIDLATPQSVVIFGQSGIRRDDPDFFAAYLLNQILGGSGFAARLMEEVREKRGLTYGISTYLVPKDLAETWQGSFASANEKVAEAIAVIREEWARCRDRRGHCRGTGGRQDLSDRLLPVAVRRQRADCQHAGRNAERRPAASTT